MISPPPKSAWMDVHSHCTETPLDTFRIHNMFIQDVTERLPEKPCSCGLHPWHISSEESAEKWLLRLSDIADTPSLLAIGEAGLDKATEPSLSLQTKTFIQHIQISETTKKPLIIHCVRAYPELLKLFMEYRPQQAWIIHGFNSSPEMAADLTNKNIHLSLGMSLIKNPEKCRKVLQAVPEHLLLLESDEYTGEMSHLYSKIAGYLDGDVMRLKERIWKNVMTIFFSSYDS